jgi:hypothetical protein
MQPGRKSAASLAVVGVGISRLAPPGTLSEGERGVWLGTVNSRPADWFGSEHIPLLVNYCRHSVRADILAAEMADFKPEWLAEPEGLKRYERLSKLARDESTIVNNLARAMRLTQQSLYRADKAASVVDGTNKRRLPWQSEEAEED